MINQNYQALIANTVLKFPFLRTTVAKSWKRGSVMGTLFGASLQQVPINQNTAQISVDGESLDFNRMSVLFKKYNVKKMKTGAFLTIEELEQFEKAEELRMGLNPFFVQMVNTGTRLTTMLERWVYTGNSGTTLSDQEIRGFLNDTDTVRKRAGKAVSTMSGMEFYQLIKDQVAELEMNVGRVSEVDNEELGISIAIPNRYTKILKEFITIPGGASPLPVTVMQAIRGLDMVDSVQILTPESCTAINGTQTNDSATAVNFTANAGVIFVGFNNPTLCGVGIDMLAVEQTIAVNQRLLDEAAGKSEGMTMADEVADLVKGEIMSNVSDLEIPEVSREIDDFIIRNLKGIAGKYNGIAPSGILPYKFDGWIPQVMNGQRGWASSGGIYTSGGNVYIPGMMVAVDCLEAAQ